MRRWTYISLVFGLGTVIGLVAYQGGEAIATALAAAGWGLALIVVYRLVPMTVDTFAWRYLYERSERPAYLRLLWARWIGDAINWLLPVLQVGGEIVKTRLLTFHAVPGRVAGASVVVDFTIGIFTQAIFTLVGVALLLRLYGASDLARGAMVFVGVLVAGLVVFYFFQRRGLFRMLVGGISRFAKGRDWVKLAGGAHTLDKAISACYRRRRAVLFNGLFQFAAWCLGTGEIWLALYFMGSPVGLADAVLLESLSQALRAAGFLIPGALGIQEGGMILLGAAVGIGPDIALALSLVKRVRELALGLPGLLAWQVAEGRRLWRRAR